MANSMVFFLKLVLFQKYKIKYQIYVPNNMRRFWDNTREEKNSEEETRTIDGNLDCEEQIMEDIERFGRVRTSLMKSLRKEFGNNVANRALWRVRKRKINGYLQENSGSNHSNSLQDFAQSVLQSLSPDTSKDRQDAAYRD